jgi:hypothetical protein
MGKPSETPTVSTANTGSDRERMFSRAFDSHEHDQHHGGNQYIHAKQGADPVYEKSRMNRGRCTPCCSTHGTNGR